MAAAQAAFRNAFVRLQFSQEAAAYWVDTQGLNSMQAIQEMSPTVAATACRTLRRPGGTINGPNNVPIPNPGYDVSLRAEANLILLVFWAQFQARVSRTVVPGDITEANIRLVRELMEDEAKAATAPDRPPINHNDWFKTMILLEAYLKDCMGRTNIPLAYVVRKDVEPMPQAADPPANYATLTDEMVARAPHGTRTYEADNRRVFTLIVEFCDDVSLTHVEDARMDMDGRAAFRMLHDHYCGTSVVAQVITKAENAMDQASYNGADRRYTFEKFTNELKQQFSVLDYLHRRNQYAGVDATSKVRRLLNAIKDSRLDATKNAIYSSDALQTDYDGCVRLFNTALAFQAASSKTKLNVSAASSNPSSDSGPPWYQKAEFDSFPQDKQDEIREARRLWNEQRGKGKGKGGKGKGKAPAHKKQVKNLKRQNNNLKRRIASLQSKKAAPTPSESSDDDESIEPTSNSKNPALSRQKVKGKGGKK